MAVRRTKEVVTDSTGGALDLEIATKTFGRNAAGNITTITASFGGRSWIKTLTRNASEQITAEGPWVAQ